MTDRLVVIKAVSDLRKMRDVLRAYRLDVRVEQSDIQFEGTTDRNVDLLVTAEAVPVKRFGPGLLPAVVDQLDAWIVARKTEAEEEV